MREEENEAGALEPEIFREPRSPAFPLHVMFMDDKISENLIRQEYFEGLLSVRGSVKQQHQEFVKQERMAL